MREQEDDLGLIILDLVTEDAYALWELSESVAKVIPDRATVARALRDELLELASKGFVRIAFREHVTDRPKYLESESVPSALADAELWLPTEASVVVVATQAGHIEYDRLLRVRAASGPSMDHPAKDGHIPGANGHFRR
jgi:hypothetical protein